MNFKQFSKLVNDKYLSLQGTTYEVDLDKDTLYNFYLDSFPDGTNTIYKERRSHDCTCCKNFIRDMGRVVVITTEGTLDSIWNVEATGIYTEVAKSMHNLVTSSKIDNLFKHYQQKVGSESTIQILESGERIEWSHFYTKIKKECVEDKNNIPTILAKSKAKFDVISRGLKELTLDSINTIIELINDNNLYRGQEYLDLINRFKAIKLIYDTKTSDTERDILCWLNINSHGASIRNSAIGTLLQDLSAGEDLESALRKFESIMAPSNYKRPKAVITKVMVDKAVSTIRELGLESALKRRYARVSDISVRDVLFVDRNTSVLMKDALTDLLLAQTKQEEVKPSKVTDIKIDDFITNILPTAESIEVLYENRHEPKLVSLIAPEDPDAKNILKWNNNFSWSYNGNYTDSITERVSKAGGNIDAPIRVSLSWFNHDDLDIHISEPDKNVIYHGSKRGHASTGALDVDMNVSPTTRSPVENVVWTNVNKMKDGPYKVMVHNFTHRENIDVGFELQVSIFGNIHMFKYPKTVNSKESVIAFNLVKKGTTVTIEDINPGVQSGSSSKEMWGLKTQKRQKVGCICLSPNFWNGQTNGNKHYMFMLENCSRPEKAKGLYNEFLSSELHDHRKVLEVLSSTMLCEPSNDQFSGLGFSSTVKENLTCFVKGTKSGNYNIIF